MKKNKNYVLKFIPIDLSGYKKKEIDVYKEEDTITVVAQRQDGDLSLRFMTSFTNLYYKGKKLKYRLDKNNILYMRLV